MAGKNLYYSNRHTKEVSLGPVIFGLFTILLLAIFEPILYYFGGWLSGIILKACIGETFAGGLNTLFNVSYFTPEFLPTMCGILSVIGKFFYSVSVGGKKED